MIEPFFKSSDARWAVGCGDCVDLMDEIAKSGFQKDESDAEPFVSVFYALDRVRDLGEERRTDFALFRLRPHAGTGWRTTNARRVAATRHRRMGKVVWQASDTETAFASRSHSPCVDSRRTVGPRSVRRFLHYGCRRAVARSAVLRHRPIVGVPFDWKNNVAAGEDFSRLDVQKRLLARDLAVPENPIRPIGKYRLDDKETVSEARYQTRSIFARNLLPVLDRGLWRA